MKFLSPTTISTTRKELAALVKFTSKDPLCRSCQWIVVDPERGSAYASTGQIMLAYQGDEKFADAKMFCVSREVALRAVRISGASVVLIARGLDSCGASIAVTDEFGCVLATILDRVPGGVAEMRAVVEKYPFRTSVAASEKLACVNPALFAGLSDVAKLSTKFPPAMEISLGEHDDAILFRTCDKRWTAYIMPMNRAVVDYGGEE